MQKGIAYWAAAMGLSRFLTLTLDQSHCTPEESFKNIRKAWNKFRVYLGRRYESSITFIAVVEPHQSGYAHLHILVDRFIPQRWISAGWQRLGGGRVVHIFAGDVRRIPGYVAKYLTKEMLRTNRPNRQRRYTTSRNIKLLDIPRRSGKPIHEALPERNNVRSGKGKWTLLKTRMEEVFHPAMAKGAVVNVRLSKEQGLEYFEVAEPG